jgi:hypothetical protein
MTTEELIREVRKVSGKVFVWSGQLNPDETGMYIETSKAAFIRSIKGFHPRQTIVHDHLIDFRDDDIYIG